MGDNGAEHRELRIVVTMIGLDGHTTGAEVVAALLRDAGMQVIYLGVNQTPEMIVRAALEEDVDAIGISSHASNYSQIVEVLDLLRQNDASEIPVICGGNVPRSQVEKLKNAGVAEVFLPGASGEDIVGFIRRSVPGR